MSNVVNFNGITKLKLDPERVINAAKDAGLTDVVILGYTEDDEYFASSFPDGPSVLWLMERLKKFLLDIEAEDI